MKILIVEDEYTIALNTQLQLEDAGHEVIGTADNYDDILEIIEEEIPDVILMDINLGNEEENGIQIAGKLKNKLIAPIIFISAYSDQKTVAEALGVKPYGYLVKPYKKEDLLIAIQVAKTNWLEDVTLFNESKRTDELEYIFYQNGKEKIKIYYTELLFLQALDNYTIIRTKKDKIVTLGYLSNVVEKLECPQLIQTHRSYFINKKNIDSVKSNTIFIDEFEIPISRSFKKEVMSEIK